MSSVCVLFYTNRPGTGLPGWLAVFAAPEVAVEGVFEAGDDGEAAPAVAVEDVEDWSGADSGTVGYVAEGAVSLGLPEPPCYCSGKVCFWWGVGV